MDRGLRDREHLLGRRQRTDGEPKRSRKGLVIAAAALLGVAVAGNSWFNSGFDFNSGDRPGLVDRDEPRGTVTIEAEQLFQAYRDDPRGSKERFGGREMVVSGEFARIVPDGYGSLDLRLKTSYPGWKSVSTWPSLRLRTAKSCFPASA